MRPGEDLQFKGTQLQNRDETISCFYKLQILSDFSPLLAAHDFEPGSQTSTEECGLGKL